MVKKKKRNKNSKIDDEEVFYAAQFFKNAFRM